jgi:hypothetical protein
VQFAVQVIGRFNRKRRGFPRRTLYLPFLKQKPQSGRKRACIHELIRAATRTQAAANLEKTNPAAKAAGFEREDGSAVAPHFCHVRFLWRFAFKRFLRLCLFIFKRRFFFRLPMVD